MDVREKSSGDYDLALPHEATAASTEKLSRTKLKTGKLEINGIIDRCNAATRSTAKILKGSSTCGLSTLEQELSSVDQKIAEIEKDYAKIAPKYHQVTELQRVNNSAIKHLSDLKNARSNLQAQIDNLRGQVVNKQPAPDAQYSVVTTTFGDPAQAKAAEHTDKVVQDQPLGQAARHANKKGKTGFFGRLFHRKTKNVETKSTRAPLKAKPMPKTDQPKVGFLRRIFSSKKKDNVPEIVIGRGKSVRKVGQIAETKPVTPLDPTRHALLEIRTAQYRYRYVMDAQIALLKDLQPHLGKKDSKELEAFIKDLEMAQAFEIWACDQMQLFDAQHLSDIPKSQDDILASGVGKIFASLWTGPVYESYRDTVKSIHSQSRTIEKILTKLEKKKALPVEGKKGTYSQWVKSQLENPNYIAQRGQGETQSGIRLGAEYSSLTDRDVGIRVLQRQMRMVMPLMELNKNLKPGSEPVGDLLKAIDGITDHNVRLNSKT